MSCNQTHDIEHARFLLAMHSSSETLGVASLDCFDPEKSLKSKTFSIGRNLSNNLLSCIEQLLPKKSWANLARLAVATGPGGFTSTRLTVVMARTLAQQVNCHLDGISSFSLMAPRIVAACSPQEKNKPFWILKHLHRRGDVGGKYQVRSDSNILACNEVIELEAPHLLAPDHEITPIFPETENVQADVIRLLEICNTAHLIGRDSHWSKVLPIYPTSPVENY